MFFAIRLLLPPLMLRDFLLRRGELASLMMPC